MKHPFYKTIRGRFLIIVFAVILILSIGTSIISYISFNQNLRNSIIHSTETNLQFLSDKIDGHMDSIFTFTKWCQTTSDIQKFLINGKTDAVTGQKNPLYNELTSKAKTRLDEEKRYNGSEKYMQRIVIGNDSRSDFLQIVNSEYSIDLNMVETVTGLPYYDELISADGFCFRYGIQEVPFLRVHTKMLPIIRPIGHPYRPGRAGFVYIEVSPALFTDMVGDYTAQEDAPVYLTIGERTYMIQNREMTLVRSSHESKDIKPEGFLRSDTLVRSVSTPTGSLTYVSMPLDTPDCHISQPISQDVFNRQFREFFFLLFFILLSMAVIGLFLMVSLSKTVTQPVRRLQNRLSAIAGGDFSADVSIEQGDNELSDIGRDINQLSSDIQHLIEQKVADEKSKKDLEYRMLQSQINPHFLYNTLNSIKWMATIQNAPGIAEMTTALAHLLKSISKGTSTIVTIQDEFTLLNDYFTIQKYRYGGAITLDYNIEDEELLQNNILRFTLQPIVENAIFHGIEPKGQSGHIEIRLSRESKGDVRIDVTDDGVGMDEELIRSVLNEETSSRSQFFKEIGISNVNKRLAYTFGEQYGLSICSEKGKFTTMTILLPSGSLQDHTKTPAR